MGYIVTDGATHPHSEGFCEFWKEVDRLGVMLGFVSIFSKLKLPVWPMLAVGRFCDAFGTIGRRIGLSTFAVRCLTMHAWFKIEDTRRDLGYDPIVSYDEGWADTAAWFKKRWLPSFRASAG